MKRLLALFCAALLAFSTPASSSSVDVWDPVTQTFKTASTAYPLPVTGTFSLGAFVPSGGAVSLSASTTSTAVALGATASTVAVANTGANTVYVLFGTTSGTTATTSNGFPVLAGQTVFLGNGANTYIAGITASSTSTLLITPGSGLPAITGGGASSGGSVTIASGGVASGAYAAGSIASGAVVSGGIADLGPYTTANTVAYFLSQIAAGTAASSTLPIYVQGSTAQAAIQADKSALLNDANATATQIVALSGSTKIYLTGYSIVAAVAENVKFQYGTGTNCGTGTTDITSLMAFAANGGISRGNGQGILFTVPSGNALCVTASTTGPTAVDVSYAQF